MERRELAWSHKLSLTTRYGVVDGRGELVQSPGADAREAVRPEFDQGERGVADAVVRAVSSEVVLADDAGLGVDAGARAVAEGAAGC